MSGSDQIAGPPPIVTIVGGGFSGAACAIHLSRLATSPVDIRIVEPRGEIGRGLAYSAADPDHRLNNVDTIHFLYPDAPDHFHRWWESAGRREADPDAVAQGGRIFVRRRDFGSYVASEVERHAWQNPSRSTISHVRDRVDDILIGSGGFEIALRDRAGWPSDAVVLATGNEPASVPAAFEAVSSADGFIADPWNLSALSSLPASAPVLIVGSGLTAADVLASLARLGHRGTITVVSRRGLWPHDQRPTAPALGIWQALSRDRQPFIDRHGLPGRAVDILRATRADAAASVAAGATWHAAFDDLRDALRTLWPALSGSEQRRIVRHLKPWYEVHRFRLPPQTKAAVDRLRRSGQLRSVAARPVTASFGRSGFSVTLRARGGSEKTMRCEAIVNCTGPRSDPARAENPALRNLLARGDLAVDRAGTGIDVDLSCRARGSDGRLRPGLFAIGPPTRSTFGEASSVPFILKQLEGALPAIAEAIGHSISAARLG